MKNEELAGKNEEFEFVISDLNTKVKKLESKLSSCQTEKRNSFKGNYLEQMKQVSKRNQLKWDYGNTNSKVNIMENSISYLKR